MDDTYMDKEFVEMSDTEARECLFAEVQALDPSITVESMMVWSYGRPRLVMRSPELAALNVELHCIFERENWKPKMDTIKIGYADLFDFGIRVDRRRPCDNLNGTVKAEQTNRYTTARRIVAAFRRHAKNIIASQLDGPHERVKMANVVLRNQYALGIALQAIEKVETLSIESLYATESYTRLNLSQYLELTIRSDKDEPTMELIISGRATPVDLLESVPYLQECGVEIRDFKWNDGGASSVTMVMNLINGYDPAIFDVIQDCRMYQRQLANHLKEL